MRRRIASADFQVFSSKGDAGTRPGGRDTFLLRGKKVPKETRPPPRPFGRRARQSLARSRGARPINWPCETPRSPLAAEGPPGRSLNSLLALRAWIPLRGTASDNATGLPPANLLRSAGQRGMKTVARGGRCRKYWLDYKSPGAMPVCLAIRASIRGPISSPSWNAKTTSGHPSRDNVRCDPDCRLSVHPMPNRAASKRLALTDGQ